MNLDVLLYLVYAVGTAAMATLTVAVCRRWVRVWQQNRRRAYRLLAGMVVLATLLVCAYALASDTPVEAGGDVYRQTFWLRMSDMLLYAVYVLVGLAVGCIVCARFGLFRKLPIKPAR